MSLENFTQNEDVSSEMDPQDIKDNKIFAILAYIGILVLIPILAAPQSKYARFHANQGLILLIFYIAYKVATGVVTSIFYLLNPGLGFAFKYLFYLCELVFLALMVLGIVYAGTDKAKSLPIIGGIHLLK